MSVCYICTKPKVKKLALALTVFSDCYQWSLVFIRLNTHWPLHYIDLANTGFRTPLILCGTDLSRWWKHSTEILVHVTASHICSTSMISPRLGLRLRVVLRNYSPHHYANTRSLNPTVWMLQHKSRLIKEATFFQTSIVSCSFRFLLLANRNGTHCHPQLL